jgi:hypothetical protein
LLSFRENGVGKRQNGWVADCLGESMTLVVWDGGLSEAAGRGRVHCYDNLRNVRFDEAPSPLTQYNNRDLPAREILLVAEILVRRNQHLEPRGLGLIQQLAVSQLFPSAGAAFRDGVVIN